jgi:hypothetical protein
MENDAAASRQGAQIAATRSNIGLEHQYRLEEINASRRSTDISEGRQLATRSFAAFSNDYNKYFRTPTTRELTTGPNGAKTTVMGHPAGEGFEQTFSAMRSIIDKNPIGKTNPADLASFISKYAPNPQVGQLIIDYGQMKQYQLQAVGVKPSESLKFTPLVPDKIMDNLNQSDKTTGAPVVVESLRSDILNKLISGRRVEDVRHELEIRASNPAVDEPTRLAYAHAVRALGGSSDTAPLLDKKAIFFEALKTFLPH